MPDENEPDGRQVAPAGQEVTAEILDRLETMPDGERRQMMAVLYQHQGPLPDPGTFAAYKTIDPEAPREILAMAKRDHEHRIDMASRMLTSEVGYRRETLWAATGLLALIVVCTTALGVTGHEVAAGVLGGAGGAMAVAGVILRGRDLFPKGEAPSVPEPPTVPTPAPPVPAQPSRGARPMQRPRRG